jgi:uncharacterized SAM-binding protein YcdF (DUF218 family)
MGHHKERITSTEPSGDTMAWSRYRLRRAVGSSIVSLFCAVGGLSSLVALTPLPNLLARPLVGASLRPESADVVIVLSGGRYADGTLTDAAIRRTVAAVRLYHQGLAPKMLFTGGPCCGTSSSSMARLARELAVPAAAILVEEQSSRTSESARNTAALLRQLGLRRALLVTSRLHILRSVLTFQASDISVTPIAAEDTDVQFVTSSSGRVALMEASLHEYVGLLYYKIRGWI